MNTHMAYKLSGEGGGKIVWIGILSCVCAASFSLSFTSSLNPSAQPLQIVIPMAVGIGSGVAIILTFVSWALQLREDLYRQHTQNLPDIIRKGQEIEEIRLLSTTPEPNIPLVTQAKPAFVWSDNHSGELVQWLEIRANFRIPMQWVIDEYIDRVAKGSGELYYLPPTSFWSDNFRHPDTGIEYRVYSEEMKKYLQTRHLATWAPWNQPVPVPDHTALFGYFGLKEEDFE
jgi:hypothetical protein